MKKNLSTIIYLLVIFIAAVTLRLLPHPPNFTPISAIAIIGGAYLSKKWSLLLPLSIMLISDYLLLYVHPFQNPVVNFSKIYPPQALFHSTTLFVYLSFIISGLLGKFLCSSKKVFITLKVSLLASVQFFIITNFGVWLTVGTYPKTLSGLIFCYTAAIPFFKNTLAGDLCYLSLFIIGFKLLNLVMHNVMKIKPQEVF